MQTHCSSGLSKKESRNFRPREFSSPEFLIYLESRYGLINEIGI